MENIFILDEKPKFKLKWKLEMLPTIKISYILHTKIITSKTNQINWRNICK